MSLIETASHSVQNVPAMELDEEGVGQRVTALWVAEGHPTSDAFATWLGVSPQRVNNVENGLALGKDLAFKMVQRIDGLTTDWLWFGSERGLPVELRDRLRKALSGLPARAER